MLILVLKEAELFIYPTAAETQYYYFDMFELYCRSYSCFSIFESKKVFLGAKMKNKISSSSEKLPNLIELS
jgi:hypothetical protein